MKTLRSDPVSAGYDRIAARFDAERGPKPWEWPYFEALADALPANAEVLDCGCGSGHLGLVPLLSRDVAVTPLDGSSAMLAHFRRRYRDVPTVLCDMRSFRPPGMFDAVIAWDSLFHLCHDDQRTMIGLFSNWLRPSGQLLFTSGPSNSAISGDMFGVAFPYASFDDGEYRELLAQNGFVDVISTFDEPGARIHKVWTAKIAP